VQERFKVVSACQVIATAIDEHIEGLSDPANLRHISSDEANSSSGWVTECASLGCLNRGSGEIHSNYLKSVRRQ
jgi:hypothetical protein